MSDPKVDRQEKPQRVSRRYVLKAAAVAAGGAAPLGFHMVVKAQGPITMRFQSTWPSKDIFHEYALDFAHKVNDMTGGDLKIEVLPAGAVVPAFGLLDAVSKGTLDGGHGVLVYHYGKQTALAMWGSSPAFGMDANMLLAWHKWGGGDRAARRRDRTGDGPGAAGCCRVQQRDLRPDPRLRRRVQGVHAPELPPERRGVRDLVQQDEVRRPAGEDEVHDRVRRGGGFGRPVVEGDPALLAGLYRAADQGQGEVLQDAGFGPPEAARGLRPGRGEEIGREPAFQGDLRLAAEVRRASGEVGPGHQRQPAHGL